MRKNENESPKKMSSKEKTYQGNFATGRVQSREPELARVSRSIHSIIKTNTTLILHLPFHLSIHSIPLFFGANDRDRGGEREKEQL